MSLAVQLSALACSLGAVVFATISGRSVRVLLVAVVQSTPRDSFVSAWFRGWPEPRSSVPRLWPLAVALLATSVASACGLSSPDQSSPAPRTGLNGGPAAPPLAHVTQTPRAALEPSLATFQDGFVVAWYDTRDGHGEIYARALSADATPAGPEWRLTSTDHDAFEADVHALGEHDFVVGWYEKSQLRNVGSGS